MLVLAFCKYFSVVSLLFRVLLACLASVNSRAVAKVMTARGTGVSHKSYPRPPAKQEFCDPSGQHGLAVSDLCDL